MRSITQIIAILLIVAGIAALAYQGFTYTQREKVAQIGSLVVTADSEKTVYFPPLVGGAALVAGIVMLVLSKKR
jgi:TRAP-type C4-dicarboxylate transport system permease small subunit